MFNTGDVVILKRGYTQNLVAKEGANARVIEVGIMIPEHGWSGSLIKEYIAVEWIRDGKDNGQSNGPYEAKRFTKVRRSLGRYKRRKAV
jgi:hypothetical protein